LHFDTVLFGYLQLVPIEDGGLGLYLNMSPTKNGRFKMAGYVCISNWQLDTVMFG
jgi:hypothetical protein